MPPKKSKVKSQKSKVKKTNELQFIPVNDFDPRLQTKQRLVWLIAGGIGLMIVIFWFWTLRQNVSPREGTDNLDKLGQEVESTIGDLKNIFDSAKNMANQSGLTEQQALDQAKMEVLQQIKVNIDSAKWPIHTSKVLGLSLQYPQNWTKKETKGIITLSSYESPENVPEVLAQVIISKMENPDGLAINDWLSQNTDAIQDYLPSEEKNIFVGGVEAAKYEQSGIGANDISYFLYVEHEKNIFEIKIYSRNGKNLYEPLLEQVVKTIKFIK
ncbi:MAG: hypothetical protein AAB358_01545 [Patescibacteria group bacterium]